VKRALESTPSKAYPLKEKYPLLLAKVKYLIPQDKKKVVIFSSLENI